MPGTTSTALPSFSHDQHHETDAAKRKGGGALTTSQRRPSDAVCSLPFMTALCTCSVPAAIGVAYRIRGGYNYDATFDGRSTAYQRSL